jgi:hypothetical protein
MAAVVFTTNVAKRRHLSGDYWLLTGWINTDTGDDAAGGQAYAVTQLDATTIERLVLFGTSVVRTHATWIKSTGKIAFFKEDGTSGIEAAVGAAALDAQTVPFLAVIRKAA